MSSQHSSDPPRTPTRTWTSLSSFSRSGTSQNSLGKHNVSERDSDSYNSEEGSSEHDMRRIVVSPAPYDDDDESTDAEEVEAALAGLDDELSSTENALNEWSSRTLDPYNFQPRILSMIAERTEDGNSRPSSMLTSTLGIPRPSSATSFFSPIMRPENPAPRSMTPSSLSRSSIESLNLRSASPRNTSPDRSLRHPARRRAGDLIAFFEDRAASDSSSLSSLGQPRSPAARSPTFPSASSSGSSKVASEASPSYTTFPRSTTLPTLDTRSGSPTKSTPATMSSLLSPARTTTSSSFLPSVASTTKQLPGIPDEPRTPSAGIRNIVAAWKERTPSGGKSSKPSSIMSDLPESGFFSVRRRDAVDVDRSLPPLPIDSILSPLSRKNSLGNNGRKSTASGASSFDIKELGPFAQSDKEPIRIGPLWYLNVHGPPPYRWIRTQAILYPHSLVLSWIAPGGGRGIVTLDLLNCNEVRSVPSPSHPSAREDIGTIAAQEQATSGTGPDSVLVDTLCPFQLLYPDGVERLGAESARDRVRWVGAVWEALNRAVSLPDVSIRSQSPTHSLRTISSERSSNSDNKSRSGSASTVFVPPLDSLPEITSSSSASVVSARSSFLEPHGEQFHNRRASDDIVLGEDMLYPLERRGSKALSRASSLRRTSSLENLESEFASAVSRTSKSFGMGIPVTISSAPSLAENIYVSPPPSAGKKSRASSAKFGASSESDTSSYRTPPSRLSARTTASSSYYSLTSPSATTPLRASQTLSTSDAQSVHIVASTLSLRGSRSASMLGDSHDDDNSSDAKTASSLPPSTPSKKSLLTTPTKAATLSRSPGVRRKTPRRSASTRSTSTSAPAQPPIEGSDKENDSTVAETFATPASPATPTERSYRSGPAGTTAGGRLGELQATLRRLATTSARPLIYLN
ncbi:hypothetical protein M422DRAFT_52213 [Sphaerobolus stellatus SS14]|uniref:PH domain-containing protein n=1 Tax=Sphaerobolus stellatus (strain SS14) TaxID=990650 RepID=A0A0C9V955_SPHS4|nr:hypothetical protein M422DRAFT_52213 [Sphaerobolus stellatus SS14]